MIWTIRTDGSQQQQVVEDSVIIYSPRWSSDGGAIYYLQPNGQSKDLMKVEIASATGKAKATAIRLQTGLQTGESFTLSKDNQRLLYNREFKFSNLWLVNPAGGNQAQTVKSRQLTTGTLFLLEPRISPDGQRIAFSVGQLPQANIFVMPIAGGPMQQLTFLNSYNTNACWSPDGKEIAFGSTKGDKPRVWKISSEGGTPHRYENSELSESFGVRLAWSPGSQILYERPGNRNFYILNSTTEAERPLVPNDSVGWMFCPRYSPDGKSVVVHWNRHDKADKNIRGLWLISLEDSSQVRISDGLLLPIEWSADGKWIYAWDQSKRPIKILQIPASGGQPKTHATLSFDDIWADGISVTPDGKRIVCAVVETKSDIWLMENFDPEVKE
jgi:Tol biopolymer transport system component